MRTFFVFGLALFIYFAFYNKVSAQNKDTVILSLDTTNIKEVKPKDKKFYDPDRAALLSAVFPGLGHIYNKKYWKLPIIYGGIVALYLAFDYNNKTFIKYRNLAIRIRDSNSNVKVDEKLYESIRTRPNIAATIDNAERGARRNRDLTIVLACGAYGLIIADSYVDAHLKGFTISKDLSFKIKPSVESTFSSGPATGIALKLSFK